MSRPRVTIRDIAAATGFHFTTVSAALKDESRINGETRRLIQKAATELGYKKDPMLSALMNYRNQKLKKAFKGMIAWINAFEDKNIFTDEKRAYTAYYQGALQKAKDSGFKLEQYWLHQENMTMRRINEIIESKNTVGVVIPPVPHTYNRINLNWEKYFSVRIGYSVDYPKVTRVGAHQFRNTCIIYENLISQGYNRLGCVLPQFLNQRVKGHFLGAFLYMNEMCRKDNQIIPPLIDTVREGDEKVFLKWFNKNQPDVIISLDSTYCNFLTQAGYSVPEDVGYCFFSEDPNDKFFSGINENSYAIGESAIETLTSLIASNKYGELETYQNILLSGKFVSKKSTRKT